MNEEQLQKMGEGVGFIAALDQSGGSTPKALKLYGISEDSWSGDEEMFDLIHDMRARIIKSPSFTGDRILGAILFEQTINRQIDGLETGDYLWSKKNIVPFLKIDKGIAEEEDGVQLLKPMPGLDELLERGVARNMFGTKERSVIKRADPKGIEAIAAQQFEVGNQVLRHGLVPILEPEIDIHAPDKAEAEQLLKRALLSGLDQVPEGQQVMFKLTPPEIDGFYTELVEHPKVLRVVALSGGYSREEANARLSRQPGVVASFSRALTEGLTAQQSDEEFDAALDKSVGSIFAASST
jgi:fructose-bisphosphate aldolase class I